MNTQQMLQALRLSDLIAFTQRECKNSSMDSELAEKRAAEMDRWWGELISLFPYTQDAIAFQHEVAALADSVYYQGLGAAQAPR